MHKSIPASPLNATKGEFHSLSPALVIMDENDVLRDEGEAYAHKLAVGGLPVTVRFLGAIHDFIMLDGLASTQTAKGSTALTISVLRQALQQPAR